MVNQNACRRILTLLKIGLVLSYWPQCGGSNPAREGVKKMKEVKLVVGLVLLVVGVVALAAAVGPVFATLSFAGLWHWSVLGALVSGLVGAGVLVRS